MKEKKRATYVVDIEADGLLDDVTKVHVVSYSHVTDFKVHSITDPDEIRAFFSQPNLTVIGHNFQMYDSLVLEKVLGIPRTYNIVDTLGVSWYLESSSGREVHGLESYGKELGVEKPKIDDWSEDNIEAIIKRCETDVLINWKLWVEVQQPYLLELYDDDFKEVRRLVDYIRFKLDCFVEQQSTGISLDLDLLLNSLLELKSLEEEKTRNLVEAMPKIPIITVKNKPKRMYNNMGDLTKLGEDWVELLHERGLPEDYEGTLEIVKGYEDGNPASNKQVKDWLYSLGWEPQHIKYVRDKVTNEVRQIPQIVSEHKKPELCDSVLKLTEIEPAIEHLAGLTTIQHRISVLEGFLRDFKIGGRIYQDIGGLTNTMRVKHRVLVNLPNPKAPYASAIRACLVSGEGKFLCGSDLSGIEDATKQSYIFPYDPEYVKELQSSDYDAHIDMGVVAGLITKEESTFFKIKKFAEDGIEYNPEITPELQNILDMPDDEQKKIYSKLKEVRQKAKVVNFSATYSVGAKTLARNMKVPLKEAEEILNAYWVRNKAIKQFVSDVKRKFVRGQLWVQQPVSGFWYSLRAEKDIFSTINQSTAVYCFDTWAKYIRQAGIKIAFQIHDELSFEFEEGMDVKVIVREAIKKTNEELKLNVVIGCSVDIGKRYTDVH